MSVIWQWLTLTTTQVRLHNISQSLATRIDEAITAENARLRPAPPSAGEETPA